MLLILLVHLCKSIGIIANVSHIETTYHSVPALHSLAFHLLRTVCGRHREAICFTDISIKQCCEN